MGTILALLLSQSSSAPAPRVPVAIVISSRRDASTNSAALCAKLQEALAAEGVQAMGEKEATDRLTLLGAVNPRACDGSKLCLARLAQLLQGVVIGVDLGKVQKFSAAHLEAVSPGRVDSVAIDFTADAKGWAKKSTEHTATFAKQVAAVVAELTAALKPVEPPKVAVVEPPPPVVVVVPPPVVDVPKQVSLVPEPPPTPPPTVVVEAKPKGPLPWVFTSAAIIAVGAAVTFLVLGMRDQSQYQESLGKLGGVNTSSLTAVELDEVARRGNLRFTIGTGSAAGAAVLGGIATFLFVREPN